jgi:23S rRNA (uracil1939-C5)-methyltransferase
MSKKKTLPVEELKIDKIVHGGQGLGKLSDGRKCFVWGALNDETVEVQLTRRKKDWAEGYATKVLSASKDRIEPLEPEIYLATSPWQIMDYQQEAITKQQILDESFNRENVKIVWREFYQQQNPFNYRNKMEYNFWFDNETQKVNLALHKRGSHNKVSVNGSALATVSINSVGAKLIDYINQNKIEARPLKSVIIRSDNNNTVGVSLFVNEKSIAKRFMDFNLPGVIFEILYSNPKSPASIATEVLVPAEQQLNDRLLGKNFSYSTRSFFQVNVPVYEVVLKILKEYISSAKTNGVIDLYSGVGSIGLSVVNETVNLTLIEISEESVEQAKINISKSDNVNIIQSAAEASLEYINKSDLLIVDPPRAGLHIDVVKKILDQKPNHLIYLSCNPSTQARDVSTFVQSGYTINYAKGFNFFPRTPHIESLIILSSV